MDWLRLAAEQTPAAPAVVSDTEVTSYFDLDRAADGVAAIVTATGAAGAPVALGGDRSVETVAAMWGLLRARATPVLIDQRWPAHVQQGLVRAAGARDIWTAPDGGLRYLIARGATSAVRSVADLSTTQLVVYTSGSEGHPKGVILTGANLAASVIGSHDRLHNGPRDAWLCVLPLAHVGGLSILWRQAHQGAPVVLLDGFDPQAVADRLSSVAFASLVPTMLRRVLDSGVRSDAVVIVGGGPSSVSLLERALAAGLRPLQSYGMTETASQIATVAPDRIVADMGTAGTPILGASVRIATQPDAMVGRLEVMGPMVSPGVIGERARVPGSWLVTGDAGTVDEQGRVTLLGRADAVVVTGGENVHPSHVQAILEDHPAVAAARVGGEPDDEWGSRVVADIVFATDADLAEIKKWAKTHLHPAEVPKEFRVVDALDRKLV